MELLSSNVPDLINTLPEYIQKFLEQPLFDKQEMLPLETGLASTVQKKMVQLQKNAATLKERYNPETGKQSIETAQKIRTEIDGLASKYLLSVASTESEEHLIQLYAQLLIVECGITKDDQFASACKQMKKGPTDNKNYSIMKGLIGEYLGKETLSNMLVSTDGTAFDEDVDTTDVVPEGEPLFDRVLSSIYIIEKRPLDESFKEGERSGLIKGQPKLYGYVVGELDSVFVIIDPMTTKYLPVIILESKGGALSTATVSKQKKKEMERFAWVRDEPNNYALANRAGKNTGSFTDITNKFDLSGIDKWLDIETSGPIRKGQQYDVTFGLTSEDMDKLARCLFYIS